MDIQEFYARELTHLPKSGLVGWKAPSNIALVKYWGKKAGQIPANPSLSFTLDQCATETWLHFDKLDKPGANHSLEVFLEGKRQVDFEPKVLTFLERITPYMPFLKEYHFCVKTSNTFPHSSGIASSASGMAALALCLMEMQRSMEPYMDMSFFNQKASFLARLGSGSACRSISGNAVVWGKNEAVSGSSDLYGLPFPGSLHPVFKGYQDTILLIDKGQKQVSSSVGHSLMKGHPFADERFNQAHQNMEALTGILGTGDLEAFMALVEREALTLHAMMMCSSPYFILMKPNTLEVINAVWDFRKETGIPLCFTLDAGANVHLLYPDENLVEVLAFIQEQLTPYCERGQFITDKVGQGAEQLAPPHMEL